MCVYVRLIKNFSCVEMRCSYQYVKLLNKFQVISYIVFINLYDKYKSL